MTPTERDQMMCDAIVDAVFTNGWMTSAPFKTATKCQATGTDYPFCNTAECPWWRGYCSRDPACDD